jgi:hypothetical protein
MRERVYTVGVMVERDELDGKGYVAEVIEGHPKVLHLFAFGDDKATAVAEVARRVVEELHYSRYNLSKITLLAVITPRLKVFTLKSLGYPQAS